MQKGTHSETRLFFCGDLMTGRGIDQILPYPSEPRLYEPWVRDARDYVALAERRNGPIERPVAFDYCWGDALAELERFAPDLRIANLETGITTCDDCWPGKGINYRMHPDNLPILTAAGLDLCTLGNNHVLDWGRAGLIETLDCLARAGIATAGAGRDPAQARAPAIMQLPGNGRLVLFALGMADSGVPPAWAASGCRAGIWRADEEESGAIVAYARKLHARRDPGDILVCSIHWGGNWGYDIGRWRRELAHRLIEAGVDIVHGHSSHHPLGIECYRQRLILYGCGDLLNDYEGIRGHEEYRSELRVLYLVRFDAARNCLLGLEVVPLRIRRMRLQRAQPGEAAWLAQQLDRESRRLGSRVTLGKDGRLYLQVQ
ncbi:CapA family protein [Marinobacterium aestuariivivens]|uniref:CapA family protein n=1 Tax=Marinobacterium aestuariivivens TaxID=1698799 RepID=A0ABW2A0N4_9GAMM